MADSKENLHSDLGIERVKRVNVNFRVLEILISILKKSRRSPGKLFLKKGMKPNYCRA